MELKNYYISKEIYSKNGDDVIYGYKIKKFLYSKRTKYQKIDIIENETFGRILFLDGIVQLSESDEKLYHRSLVKPVSKFISKINKALVVGGGDGGAARELLKIGAKEVFLVDLDKEVIEASKRFLPFLSKGVLDNKKVKIFIGEGNEFIKGYKDFFDVIIIDPTDGRVLDKTEYDLFKLGFYRGVFDALREKGVVSIQVGPSVDTKWIKKVSKDFQSIFSKMDLSRAFIPSYFQEWVFITAQK